MKVNEKRSKFWLTVSIILIFLCLFLGTMLGVLYIKKYTPQKLLSKFGIKVADATDYSLFSWNSSLEQLVYDADIVFIGDSLTRGENFQEYFPDKKILNLGRSGDTVSGVSERSHIISRFTPEKIFVMVGVNSLGLDSVDDIVSQYETMIINLKNDNPSADIFVQSVLPVNKSNKNESLKSNNNIINLNEKLHSLAKRQGVTYIDVYSVYVLDGEMNPQYTVDGIHLKEEYKYLWLDVLSKYIN